MNSIRAIDEGSFASDVSPDVLIPLSWACVGLTAAFLCVRTYIRFWLISQQNNLWPDLWIYLSFIFLTVNAVLVTLITPIIRNDIPSKVLPTPNPETTRFARLQFAYMILFWSVLWAIKGVFLALFKPLLVSTSSHNMRRSWWAVTIFTIITYTTCWVAAFLTINPGSIVENDKPRCFGMFCESKRRILITYTTAVDILTDIFMIALPVRLIWAIKTRLSTSQRVALTGIFTISFLIIAVALVRGIALAEGAESRPAWVIIWSVMEATIAVIVGCLPTYKALFSSRTGPLLSRRSRSEITEITSITPRHSTTTLNSVRGPDDYRNGSERKSSKESRANSTTPILSDEMHGPIFGVGRPQDRSWRRTSPTEPDAHLVPNESFKPARAEPINGSISPYSKAWIPPKSIFHNYAFNATPPSPSPSHANTLPENLHSSGANTTMSHAPNFSRSRISPPLQSDATTIENTSRSSRLRRKSDSLYFRAPSCPPRSFPLIKSISPLSSPPKPSPNHAPMPPPPPPSHLRPPARRQTPLTTPILETPPPTAGNPPLSPLKRNPSSAYSVPLSPGIYQVRSPSSGRSSTSTPLPPIDTSGTHVRSNTLTSDPPVMSPRIRDFTSEAASPLWLSKSAFPRDGS